MRRICCFCESWESGGIEAFLKNILLHINSVEFEIDIVAAQICESVFTEKLKACGIRFFELSGKIRSGKNIRLFRRFLRERKYDVIHFNFYQGMSLYYVQIAKQEGVPVRIAHSHNTALRKSCGQKVKYFLHLCGKNLFTSSATELWACSEEAANFLFKKSMLLKKGYRFIPNGIEVKRFELNSKLRQEVREELGVTADTFVIGNVGRLCYQKNQDFLLEIFAEVVKQKPNSCLLIVGSGEQKKYLKEKAQRLEIISKVIFYGVTDHIERLYWAMDVFAFPSHFEGLGIVAVEAQAAGLPVVCSEYIPQEAFVSSKMTCCPLEKGTATWSDCLLQVAEHKRDKGVIDLSFDIEVVTATIQKAYMGET